MMSDFTPSFFVPVPSRWRKSNTERAIPMTLQAEEGLSKPVPSRCGLTTERN
jgi:hypothetical protein